MVYRCFAAAAACALLAACGGGGDSTATAPAPPPALQLAASGVAITKVRSGSGSVMVMQEKLRALTDPGPERRLVVLDDTGMETGRYVPPQGWSLIDFTQHASGEASVVLATAREVKLVRLDRTGAPRDETALADPQAATDPYYDNGGLHDDGSLLPYYTRDAVRVAAIGEGLAMALRTGRNAVVAYRFEHAAGQGYTRAWRTLVEPGLSMFAIGITSGTFDTFDQLTNHWRVHVDADAAGDITVAVTSRQDSAPIFARHADYFGEVTSANWGVLVTRLAPDGRRLGSTPIASSRPMELHGLRLAGDDIALAGRVFSSTNGDGSGWDAYSARVDRTSGAVRSFGVIDVDKGEILFDMAPLAQGRFLAAGAAGYTENPAGASISEQAAPMLLVLESDGSVKQRLDFPAGARQNQLRSLAARGGRWLIGGMVDGPGTHSGDADPALIRADGFVRDVAVP